MLAPAAGNGGWLGPLVVVMLMAPVGSGAIGPTAGKVRPPLVIHSPPAHQDTLLWRIWRKATHRILFWVAVGPHVGPAWVLLTC